MPHRRLKVAPKREHLRCALARSKEREFVRSPAPTPSASSSSFGGIRAVQDCIRYLEELEDIDERGSAAELFPRRVASLNPFRDRRVVCPCETVEERGGGAEAHHQNDDAEATPHLAQDAERSRDACGGSADVHFEQLQNVSPWAHHRWRNREGNDLALRAAKGKGGGVSGGREEVVVSAHTSLTHLLGEPRLVETQCSMGERHNFDERYTIAMFCELQRQLCSRALK